MAEPPRQVGFVGKSGSGKTTLIEALLPRLAECGLRVGVVKHTHHRVDWDTAGKDSWRFREAGAARVVLLTPELVMSEAMTGHDDAAKLTVDLHLVVHEGDRSSDLPKVLVGEAVDEARARGTKGRVLAVVGAPCSRGLRRFERDDVAGIASLLVRYAGRARAAPAVDCAARPTPAAAAQGHLCPGQALGLRIAMRGLDELGLGVPPPQRRIIAILETGGCAADAVASVTGCSLASGTLKHVGYGKMAASFLDLESGKAIRVAVRHDGDGTGSRRAAPGECAHAAYERTGDDEVLMVERVYIDPADAGLKGEPRSPIRCSTCGEDVSDGLEIAGTDGPLCRSCAGPSYYRRP